MRLRQFAVVCAAVITLCVALVVSAQRSLPSAYFLGTEDRNGDGVSDLSDGLNLYAVMNGKAAPVNAPEENVRNYRPDLAAGRVAYIAQSPGKGATLTLVAADGQRASVALKGLKNAVVQHCGDAVWITAQDAKGATLVIGYDLTLTERERHAAPLTNPTITIDPTGQWLTAYDQDQRTLQLYSLPGLTLTPLPTTSTPWGPPVWAEHSARFAVPLRDEADPTQIKIAVVEPPTGLRISNAIDVTSDRANLVQAQWSAHERYLTFRTLPGTDLTSALILKLIDTGTQAVSRFDEKDVQLRVVDWSSDDRYALVSEASSPLGDQISVNYRILDPVSNQFVAGDPVNTFVSPVAFAWQPNAHVLAILGTSLIDSKPGIFTFDVESGAVSTLYNTDDEDLLKSNLFWSGDGSSILFTAGSTDALSELTGVTNSLRLLDVKTAKAAILSPDDVSVLPYGIQVH